MELIPRRHIRALPYEVLKELENRIKSKFEQRPENYIWAKSNHWVRLNRLKGRISVELNRRHFNPWRQEYVHTY